MSQNDIEGGITFDGMFALITELRERYPVVYYYASEYVPGKDRVYKIPNTQARSGYDLVFHPDLLDTIIAEIGNDVILRPMDAAEDRQRRSLITIAIERPGLR